MLNRKIAFTVLLLVALSLGAFGSALAQDDMMMEPPPGFDSWDAVVAAADGATVNWYMWGGSDSINGFVDTIYGVPLMGCISDYWQSGYLVPKVVKFMA